MKKLIITTFYGIILLLITQSIMGQRPTAYRPYDFENYTPQWKHVIYDSSIVGWQDKSDNNMLYPHNGWSHLVTPTYARLYYNHLVDGDYLYIYSLVFRNVFQGAYIEKLNLNTGQHVWDNHFDRRDNNRREFPYFIYENKNEEINVIGARQHTPDSTLLPYPLWYKADVFSRSYDNSDGTLVQYTYADNDDTSAVPIAHFFNYLPSVKTHLFPYDSLYQFVYSNVGNDNVLSYCNYIVDRRGHLVRQEQCNKYYMSHPKYQVNAYENAKVDLDTFVSLVHTIKNKKDKLKYFDLNMLILNRDMDSLHFIDLKPMVNPAIDYKLSYIDRDYFIVRGFNKREDNGSYYDVEQFYLFEITGRLLEKVEILHNQYEVLNHRVSVPTKLKYDIGMLLCTSETRYDSTSYVGFYKSDGKGHLQKVKELDVVQKNNYIDPTELIQLGNGDIVFYHTHYNFDLKDKLKNTGACILSLIPAKDLQLSNSVSNPKTIEADAMSLTPNPASEELAVQFSRPLTGKITIVDILGKTVLSKKVKNRRVIKLRLNNLPNGEYVLSIQTEQGSKISRIFTVF